MQAPVKPGDVVAGKYQIEHLIARGGMGVLFAARHIQLEQRVALKFMLSELLTQPYEPDAVSRFLREGRAAARLRGEHVARILDVDTLPAGDGQSSAAGTPYMVMEYLEGIDLKDLVIERGPLPVPEAVDYVLQACVAMAEAHRAGIVHRDLKPDNLFLTQRPDGSPLVKVLDFGISKLYELGGDGSDTVKRTRAAVVMGSPAYMSPEQARSARDADPRSDIWSLGVILYELASRSLPYNANVGTAEMIAQLLYEPPRSLARVIPKLPAAFCAAVDRCLSKDPAMRPASVADLAESLAEFATPAGRAHVASIRVMVTGPHGQATRGYSGMTGEPTLPWQELAPASAHPPADDDLFADAFANLDERSLSMLDDRDRPAGQGKKPLEITLPPSRTPAPARHQSLELDPPEPAPVSRAAPPARAAAPHQAGKAAAIEPAAAAIAPAAAAIEIDYARMRKRKAAGMNDPFAASAGDIVEHDLAPLAGKPAIGLAARPRPQPVRTRTGTMYSWLDARRMAILAVMLALAGLTVASMVSFGTVLAPADRGLYKLGHFALGRAGLTVQLIGASLTPLVVPLALYLALARRFPLASCVFLWWLGENLAFVAHYIADAPTRALWPITGAVHPFTYLLNRWQLVARADLLGNIARYGGLAIMLGALILQLRRLLGERPRVLR